MDETASRARPYALKAGEGWTYRFGIDFTVKSGEVRAGSGAAFCEYASGHGDEPPDHTHMTEDELFYVLEGALTFRCGGQTFDVQAGGFIFLPRGVQHGYTIRGEERVRLIAVTYPVRDGLSGGWGGFVSDIELGQGQLIAKPQPAGREPGIA
jgi:quercetin dioxygenase-like cupin family protein